MDIFLFGELYEELIDIAAHLPHSIFNEMIRLRSGHLVKDMLDHFEDKKNSKLTPDRSIWIYSGHDYTINKFMTFLGFHEVIRFYEKSLHEKNYARVILLLGT